MDATRRLFEDTIVSRGIQRDKVRVFTMTREPKASLYPEQKKILGVGGLAWEGLAVDSRTVFPLLLLYPLARAFNPSIDQLVHYSLFYTLTTYDFYIYITATRIVYLRPITCNHSMPTLTRLSFSSMGQTLSEPIVDKKSSRDHNDRFAYGASAMQGWRLSILFYT